MPRKKLQNRIEILFAELKEVKDDVQDKPESLAMDSQAEKGERLSFASQRKLPAQVEEDGESVRYSVPLSIRNSQKAYLEVLDDRQGRIWREDEKILVQQVADQLSLALENAYLFQETQQRLQELGILYAVNNALTSATMQPKEIARTIVQEYVRLFSAESAKLFVLDLNLKSFRVLAESPVVEDSAQPTEGSFLISDYLIIDQVLRNQQPLVLTRDDGLFPLNTELTALDNPNRNTDLVQPSIETISLIPLVLKGQTIGVIQLEWLERNPQLSFDAGQMELGLTIANVSAVVLENARLYEAQIETSDRLRELDQLKSQFLANMSHELRTPLNSIIGFSRVILKGIDGPVTETQQQDLTAIHNAGTHLLELINDILDFSKIEAGKMELVLEDAVSISELVDSALSTAAGLAKDKLIHWERQIEDNLPEVRCDPTRIRQVLINLLSNAVKFTNRGSITVQVVQRAISKSINGTTKNELVISVKDTGIGIPESDQMRLFRPFTQLGLTPSLRIGGTGLGLSISRLLVELHGGRIGVESVVGTGSTFFFTLPV